MFMASHTPLPNDGAHRSRCAGFTLIELIIVMVLMGILAVVGVNMLSDSFSASRAVNDGYSRETEARYVMERLAREVREVKYLSSGSYCLTMSASSLVFQKPTVDSSDQLNCNTDSVTVTISFNNANHAITVTYSSPANATGTLTNAVTNNGFGFLYYQADGVTPATSATDVRIVKISLAITDPSSTQALEQTVRVSLRNAS